MASKIGQQIPSATFKTLNNSSVETVTSEKVFNDKNVLVIGVVGAFTPVCTHKHLPEFIPYAKQLVEQGLADSVICISVVDPFVLHRWSETLGAQNLLFLTDTNAEFAKQLDLDIDLSHLGMGVRSNRYAMFVKSGIISMLNVEESPSNVIVTAQQAVESQLK